MVNFDYSEVTDFVGTQKYDSSTDAIEPQEGLRADESWVGSFIYFHTVDKNAVARAHHTRKEYGDKISQEEMQRVGAQALQNLATSLGKEVSDLTYIDKLDRTSVKFKKLQFYPTDIPGAYKIISRLGKDGVEADRYWQALGKEKSHYLTVFLKLPTKRVRKGNVVIAEVDAEAFFADPENSVEFCLLDLVAQTYDNIKKAASLMPLEQSWGGTGNPEAGLHNYDVRIFVKQPDDVKFKKYECSAVGPAKYLEYAAKNPRYLTWVMNRARDIAEHLVPNKYRELTTDELRAKVAGVPGAPAAGSTPSQQAGGNRSVEAANTVALLNTI